MISAVRQGLLSCRRHIGKREDPGDEVEKTLAHSRNHVTDLSTERGNLFKMAAKIKSERIWVRGLETGEKQTKWRQRQTQKKLKI